jgi:hypothetical protein
MINFESLVYIKRWKTNIIFVYGGQIWPITPNNESNEFLSMVSEKDCSAEYCHFQEKQNTITSKNISMACLKHF